MTGGEIHEPSSRTLTLKVLFAIDAILVAAYLGEILLRRKPSQLLDMGSEANLPAWWSGAQLLLAGLLFAVVSYRNVVVERTAWLLGCFAALLVLLSLDEVSGLHERAGFLVDDLLIDRRETIFDRTGLWFAVIGIPFVVALAFLLSWVRASLNEVPSTTRRVVVGFALLLSGAVGVEAMNSFASPDGERFVIAVEEGLEMLGGSVLLWAGWTFASRHRSTSFLKQLSRPLVRDPAMDGTRPVAP